MHNFQVGKIGNKYLQTEDQKQNNDLEPMRINPDQTRKEKG